MLLVHVRPGGDVLRRRGPHRNRRTRHVLRRGSRVRHHDAGLSPARRHHRRQVRVGIRRVRDHERVVGGQRGGQRLGLALSGCGRGRQLRCVALRQGLLHV